MFSTGRFSQKQANLAWGFPYASQIKMVAQTAPKEETKVAARARGASV